MFKEDLAFGNEYENKYIEYKNFRQCVHMKGYFKYYDIEADGVFYEVKTDRLAHKTGNFCIEYEYNSKPSGITATKADIYAYIIISGDDFSIYEIPTKIIREFIDNKKYRKNMSINGGKTKMYLFSLELFLNYKVKGCNGLENADLFLDDE